METDRIRYFCAIVDTGSLTKASELLGVSHSGLSKAMSVLQAELGFKVFTPKGRGLELTEKGKGVYLQGRKMLEIWANLKNQSPTNENTLRIGFPEVLALAVSEPITRELKGEIMLEDLDTAEPETRVLERKSDFAFTFIPFPNKEIEHLKIASVSFVSYCLTGHFQERDPEKIPYVVPAHELRDNPLSLRIRDGWNSSLTRHTPYRANSLSIALKMVQSGACAVYAPSFLIHHLNQFEPKERRLAPVPMPQERRAKEKTNRDLFLVKRAADEESKAMKAVSRLIRQVCRANS